MDNEEGEVLSFKEKRIVLLLLFPKVCIEREMAESRDSGLDLSLQEDQSPRFLFQSVGSRESVSKALKGCSIPPKYHLIAPTEDFRY